jgi:hypothetical protein
LGSVKLRSLVLACFVLVLLAAPIGVAHAETPGQWTKTTNYPLALAGDSCVAVSPRVYCVGGFGGGGNSHNQVYYAALTSSGIGSWSAGPAYPIAVDSAACVNSTSNIYCVGGENYPNNVSNVYYAPASSSAFGPWSSAASYPSALAGVACVVYSGYIYCVGGFNGNGDEVSSTYYAPISSGLTSWSGTTQYPLAVDRASCMVYASDIYCVGGETEVGSNQNSPISNAYYAPLTSSGIGQWTAALSYPTALASMSCAAYSGYVYCVGGFDSNLLSSADAYFGQSSPLGMSSWGGATQYPVPIDTSSCVAASGYLYCVGGNSVNQNSQTLLNPIASAYYAQLSTSATQTSTTPEFPVTAAIPVVLAAVLLIVAGASRLTKRGG